jgi:flavin-dependent dehydrogenase
MNRYDAIVIGAGPAGSTAALLLARAGWSVALVEKQVFPRRKVCGECIAAPNLALIEQLGLGEAFDTLAGAPLRQVAIFSGDQTIRADLPAFGDDRYRWGRALGREHLDQMLLQQAGVAGATILQPYAALAVEGEPGRFTCTVAPVENDTVITLAAPVIIAANGSWEPSLLREARPRKKPGDLFGFKANYRNSALDPALLPVLALPGAYGGMVIGDHDTATLACCIRRDVLSACRLRYRTHTAAQAVEAYIRDSCRGVAEALAGAELQEAWLSVGPIRPGIRMQRHREVGVFPIGNAAGEAHPIIGEGISMAMQSAWLLCRELIARKAMLATGNHRELWQRYRQTWCRSFAGRLRIAALYAHIAMRPALSRGLLSVLQRWPALLTHGARLSGKTRLAVEP